MDLGRNMKFETPDGLRLLHRIGGAADRPPARSRVVGWVALAVLLLVGIAAMVSQSTRALRTVPPLERAELVRRTVDELERFCGPDRPVALREHCRDLARFASSFDECTGPCKALVRNELASEPTR